MNVAIKSGQLQKALEVYHEMLREGCTPNVVTYNTLIDVYGKTGQWGEALRVIDTMNASNTKPVTRTYNTLMIACNTSGQWQEALNVYNDMVRRGHQPNTTTYNALVSAYSKAGRLEKVADYIRLLRACGTQLIDVQIAVGSYYGRGAEFHHLRVAGCPCVFSKRMLPCSSACCLLLYCQVMEVYQDMMRTGCERSVITYSALISACEKAGQWQLAVNLFGEMLREGCTPNVITYNSLITACAQVCRVSTFSLQHTQYGRHAEHLCFQGCRLLKLYMCCFLVLCAPPAHMQWCSASFQYHALIMSAFEPAHPFVVMPCCVAAGRTVGQGC
jgi:pentatricopeptide repeat domain-containing protein 1